MSEFVGPFFIVILIFGLGLLLLIGVRTRKRPKSVNSQFTEGEYQKIKDALNSKDLAKVRGAVLTADKLVDYLLKAKGFSGDTLALKVKSARKELGDTYEKFWDAHRTRNRLVHEIENEVRFNEAKEALKKYKEVIEKLKV